MTDKPKSVIIDYDLWHNYYVPMEKENERLAKQIAEHHVGVFVSTKFYSRGEVKIGYLDAELNFNADEQYNSFLGMFLSDLRFEDWGGIDIFHRKPKEEKLLNKKQAKYYLEKINERLVLQSEMQKNINNFKVDHERKRHIILAAEQNLKDKINKLPKIVRWLFNIKKV